MIVYNKGTMCCHFVHVLSFKRKKERKTHVSKNNKKEKRDIDLFLIFDDIGEQKMIFFWRIFFRGKFFPRFFLIIFSQNWIIVSLTSRDMISERFGNSDIFKIHSIFSGSGTNYYGWIVRTPLKLPHRWRRRRNKSFWRGAPR